MKQLSFEEAKRLSLKKWKIIQKHGLSSLAKKYITEDIELQPLCCYCGFCERWLSNIDLKYLCIKNNLKSSCRQCELYKVQEHSCFEHNSIHRRLFQEKDNSLILLMIKNIKKTKPNN